MRTAILVTAVHTLVSALIPAGSEPTNELCEGMTIALARDFENEHGRIPKGSRGYVVQRDRVLGAYWCFMEGMEPALMRWDNMLVLWAYENDDLISALQTVGDEPIFTASKASQLAPS
jgi:hypothetical protein